MPRSPSGSVHSSTRRSGLQPVDRPPSHATRLGHRRNGRTGRVSADAGHGRGATRPAHGRRARAHRRLLAGRQLPVGRPDLPARQPAAPRALWPEHVKPRLLGHWGTTPGLNFIYAHMNRVIRSWDLDAIYVMGPGHGGPATVANAYLEGTYSEVYPSITRDERRPAQALPPVLVPGRHPEPRRAGDPGFDPRGRRARLRARARVRGRLRQPGPAGLLRRRRWRGRDRPARHELALEQVPRPGPRRGRPAHPAPQRLQDRQPHGPRPDPARRAAWPCSRATATTRISWRATSPALMHQAMACDDGPRGRGDRRHPARSPRRPARRGGRPGR